MLCDSIGRAIEGFDISNIELRPPGWCVVRSLLDQDDVQSIKLLIEENRQHFTFDRIAQKDFYGGSRLYAMDLPTLKPLHFQVGVWVGQMANVPVKPSYSFALINLQDYVLRPHRDRPACKYSVNISIAKTCDSPIFMEGAAVELQPGDAIYYRACDVTHWRDVLRGNNEITNLVLHYADLDCVFR